MTSRAYRIEIIWEWKSGYRSQRNPRLLCSFIIHLNFGISSPVIPIARWENANKLNFRQIQFITIQVCPEKSPKLIFNIEAFKMLKKKVLQVHLHLVYKKYKNELFNETKGIIKSCNKLFFNILSLFHWVWPHNHEFLMCGQMKYALICRCDGCKRTLSKPGHVCWIWGNPTEMHLGLGWHCSWTWNSLYVFPSTFNVYDGKDNFKAGKKNI